MRIGEASALRWDDYNRRRAPLGELTVASSFNSKALIEKGVKTEMPRSVPVHPELARILAQWRETGWPDMLARKAAGADLIMPSRTGSHRRASRVLRRFKADCECLGLRPRRIHDGRRTFISIARDAGAHKDLLKWVTHGPQGDIVDTYTTPSWESLCQTVEKVPIGGSVGPA
jgi:integrase